MEAIETYTHNNLYISIFYDLDPEDPTTWADPVDRQGNVTFALKHGQYNLPFELNTPADDDFSSWQEFAEFVTGPKGELPGYKYRFVRWYEHSGIAVSLQDSDRCGGWDSGCAGVIFGKTLESINQEFEPYAAFISGNVYGFNITGARTGDLLDSCWGYYTLEHCQEDAQASAESVETPNPAKYAPIAQELHN